MNDDNPYASPREQGAKLSKAGAFPFVISMIFAAYCFAVLASAGIHEAIYHYEAEWGESLFVPGFTGIAVFGALAIALQTIEERKETP